jgi:hypothetical protein
VPLEGQADILITGIPYISPYNVNSKALNPLLVQVMALGYFFNMYRNKCPLKKGGTLIFTHPCTDSFDPVHHPSYIEFFNRLLPESRDAYYLEKRYQDEFAYNPTYIEMYRRGNAYHGAHPFYMYYWGQAGREWCGDVIAVGADNRTVPGSVWLAAGGHAGGSDLDGSGPARSQLADHDAAPPAGSHLRCEVAARRSTSDSSGPLPTACFLLSASSVQTSQSPSDPCAVPCGDMMACEGGPFAARALGIPCVNLTCVASAGLAAAHVSSGELESES